MADGGLDLGVVSGAFSVGVGVVDEDDGSGTFGDSFERGEEFSDFSCVSGLGFCEGGVEGVDDDDSTTLADEEVFDLLQAGEGVDGFVTDGEEEGGVFGEVLVAVDCGEDFGGGVVEADVADGGFGDIETGEGFTFGDGAGEGYGKGGFSGLGETGEEDQRVFDEEGFGSVGARVGVEVLRFDLLELVVCGSVGAVGVADKGDFLVALHFWVVVFGPEVGVLGLVGVVVFDHHCTGEVFRGLSTMFG